MVGFGLFDLHGSTYFGFLKALTKMKITMIPPNYQCEYPRTEQAKKHKPTTHAKVRLGCATVKKNDCNETHSFKNRDEWATRHGLQNHLADERGHACSRILLRVTNDIHYAFV